MRRIDDGGDSRFVACHAGLYPYTVFMCHDTGAVRAYMADMEGARGGGKVTVAIICHTDTSLCDPEHMSFRLLGTRPGGEPVCHFMPYGHIMFAKNNATTRSSASCIWGPILQPVAPFSLVVLLILCFIMVVHWRCLPRLAIAKERELNWCPIDQFRYWLLISCMHSK
ncbi:hypothetical protein EJB05_49640, partial [Eragrostis curvula]